MLALSQGKGNWSYASQRQNFMAEVKSDIGQSLKVKKSLFEKLEKDNMKCEGQQIVTIYQNISRIKTGTQELSTVNKIHVEVGKSFIDQHPHAGNALELPIDYIEELPQLITFVVVHPRDKLILKYSPQQLEGNSMCPCVLRDYNLK